MIGKIIKTLLVANADLMGLVPETSLYPYVANEGTLLPLCTYAINSVEPKYDKDGWAHDLIKFSITSYSEDYATLQSIVAQVRAALELKYVTDSTHRIILAGMLEGFNIVENVFMNRLMFEIKVHGYD